MAMSDSGFHWYSLTSQDGQSDDPPSLDRQVTLLAGTMKRLRRHPQSEDAVLRALEAIGRVFAADAVSVIGTAADAETAIGRRSSAELYRWERPGRPRRAPSAGPAPARSCTTAVERGDDPVAEAAPPSRSCGQAADVPEPGEGIILTFPVHIDGQARGKVLVESDEPTTVWSRAELALLELTVQDFGRVLDRATEASADGASVKGGTSRPRSDGLPQKQTTRELERRIRAERALVKASRLLLTSDECDFNRLMEIVGTATEASYAYLIVITPDDVPSGPGGLAAAPGAEPFYLDTYQQYEWSESAPPPSAASAPEADDSVFAVPLLSGDDQLFGYIGIEYSPEKKTSRDEDARIVGVLGDMLCSYLQRQISEEALRRSENRYRHFVDTISEAIWRIEIAPPIPVETDPDEQVEQILTSGTVAECNGAAAQLFGVESPDEILGRPLGDVGGEMGWMDALVRDIVAAEYRLRQHEHVVGSAPQPRRHFVVNTVGAQEDGCWSTLWGSTTEVTERVQLERRMVATLERQQRRIGRDLHDRVGQQLAGTRMLAQNLAARYFPDADQPGRDMIDRIVRYVQEAAQHVSDLQRGVMPVQVDRDGLAQALAELASRTGMMAGIECVYHHDGCTDVIDHEVKLQLYRIAQEATRNAITHGNPHSVNIRLHTVGESILVEVEDDGDGFEDPNRHPPEPAFGLHSMRYRARSIGAVLTIDSGVGAGTAVRCRLPKDRLPERPRPASSPHPPPAQSPPAQSPPAESDPSVRDDRS